MKKNWIYLVLILVLATAYWYLSRTANSSSFSEKEAYFTVSDTGSIRTIFLSNIKGERIKLTRTESSWVLNDSLTVRMDAVNGLLRVLAIQYPEKPVAPGYHDAAIRELSNTATKVEIYNEKERTHQFYVSQIPAPNNATYMLNVGAKRPFVVKIPLENNYVGIRYFTSLSEWRSKQILFTPNPVQSIEVSYPDSAQYNFRIQKNTTDYLVQLPTPPTAPINQKRLNAYLGFYDKFYCTGFESTYQGKDSIVQRGRKMAEVTLQRMNSSPETLSIFFKPVSRDSKHIISLGGKEYEGNYFFGWLNNRDFIVLNLTTVQTLLRRGHEFFEAEPGK